MPELPEVQALADLLTRETSGKVVARVDVANIAVLKTYDPPTTSLHGLTVSGATRHGKFLDLDVDGLHLVIHLARAGWLRMKDTLPPAPPKPTGKGPLALRVHLDDGSGFDVTEAGTQKSLAVYVVRQAGDVPGIARLGIDPLSDEFTPERLHELLQTPKQVKGVLRDQQLIAGIGNAYSDEVLHAARLSPFKPANKVQDVAGLHAIIQQTLRDAIANAHHDFKKEKKAGLRVHGRAGEKCPVCGDTIREVSFADRALQYCPTCQTDGKPLADRRLSRLLK